VAEIAPAGRTERPCAEVEQVLPTERRLRDSELFLLALALAAGAAAGVGVVLIDLLLAFLRWVAFGIALDGHLSDIDLGPARILLMPVLGGLLVGLVLVLLRRWRPREIVDAIEANALLGGRMSVADSMGLVAATLLSGGFGASVGMEAAYTQLGAALASRLGRTVELRRDDIRTLVGCGAAGAIAAAFNAPLTGAFYAFELIIGSYTLQTLAPVGIAALTGALVVRGLVGSTPIFVVSHEITWPRRGSASWS
jgi:CIC family chloride channel protein